MEEKKFFLTRLINSVTDVARKCCILGISLLFMLIMFCGVIFLISPLMRNDWLEFYNSEKWKRLFGFEKQENAVRTEMDNLLFMASHGDPDSQFKLGEIYANGQGVTQDYAEAVKWYRQAVERRHVKAQFALGLMYYNGRGVEKDLETAKSWYRKAAAQGHEGAKQRLQRLGEN